MPIKFRCSYCRQFLGISRAQAGEVVDCPTCGRSIRVPLLDGTIQPMDDPELDPEDTHLARALDELAKLSETPAEPISVARSHRDDAEAENQIPQPLPEPIPIEVPLPPTPVAVQQPTNATLASSVDNNRISDHGLLAELLSISAAAESKSPTPKSVSIPETLVTQSLYALPTQSGHSSPPWRRLAVMAAVFLGGMLLQRFTGILGSSRYNRPSTNSPAIESVLTGRITYKTKEGDSQPDRGARVLIFPQERLGTVKLSPVGFRPADGPLDQQVADAAMKILGGGTATVDDLGNYRVPMEAGTYRVLVLSHFQPRDDSPADPLLDVLLSEYFERPQELLGRVQHMFAPLRIKGANDVWDHSF